MFIVFFFYVVSQKEKNHEIITEVNSRNKCVKPFKYIYRVFQQQVLKCFKGSRVHLDKFELQSIDVLKIKWWKTKRHFLTLER